MNLIALPDILTPQSQEWGLKSHSRVFTSAFTGYKQSIQTPGAMWTCKYSYPLVTEEQMKTFKAFLVRLRGQSVAFTAQDFGFTTGQASAGVTANATKGAATAILNGAYTFQSGDYVTIGTELKMIVDDSSGTQITIEPPFRAEQVSAPVITENPFCAMLLNEDSISWPTKSPVISALEFSGTEFFV